MSEHVEHVIADGPPPEPPPIADRVAVIEAEADAAADVIEAAADAEVKVIEARAENPEWQQESLNVIRSQAESFQAGLDALRTDMTLALASLSERVDQLTPPPPPPEPPDPNPDHDQNEKAPEDGAGNTDASAPPEAETEAAKEPVKPERKRAHRWI